MNNTAPQVWNWRVTGCSTQDTDFNRNVYKCSIYPVYYGCVTSGPRPTPTNSMITTGCIAKPVVLSTSTVCVTFGSVGQWTWLAIPSTSPSRDCWYVDALNSGVMPGDKYPDEVCVDVTSAEGCWSTVEYKVYMSGFAATDATQIQFRN